LEKKTEKEMGEIMAVVLSMVVVREVDVLMKHKYVILIRLK
jgi:hypothetical protein